MPAIELQLLGHFEVRDNAGRSIVLKARKNRALLAILALAPGQSLRRERMTSLLWSDRGEPQARNSLRQALMGLRTDLAVAKVAALDITDERASINTEHLGIDVLEFIRLSRSADPAALRRAVSLYRGELLADTFFNDRALQEWLSTERQRLAEIASTVMEKLINHETGVDRIELAKRLVALDPFREASHRLLMQAYNDAGERALALRQYEICRDTLREELQIVPGEQTEALRRRCMEATTARRSVGPQVPLQPAAAEDRPVIAVLPFQTFGSDPEIENFCDGLSEDIITGLSRIKAIRVVARSTMFTYKHRALDIRGVGRELGARYVLEGSVRSSGTKLRVAAQLIDASSGHHIWAEQRDHSHGEIFDLQNGITRNIVASVQAQLIMNEGHGESAGPENQSNARLLAKSWRKFLGLTADSLAECEALATRVLGIDPNNGTAHRMVAAALYHQMYMGFRPWDHPTVERLFKHAKTAIESEDADEYSHWAMECAYLLKGRHELAAASLRRALEINPNFALGYGSLATVQVWSGNYEDSIMNNELALSVSSQDPSNFYRHFGLALAHYLASRPEKAVDHARIVIQARPGWWLAQIVYVASLVNCGRLAEAQSAIYDCPELDRVQLAMLPFAKPGDRERLLADLRLAGLPRAERSPSFAT